MHLFIYYAVLNRACQYRSLAVITGWSVSVSCLSALSVSVPRAIQTRRAAKMPQEGGGGSALSWMAGEEEQARPCWGRVAGAYHVRGLHDTRVSIRPSQTQPLFPLCNTTLPHAGAWVAGTSSTIHTPFTHATGSFVDTIISRSPKMNKQMRFSGSAYSWLARDFKWKTVENDISGLLQ